MGFFSGVSNAAKSVGSAVQDAGKSASRTGLDAFKTGATGTFEYEVAKPLQSVLPKAAKLGSSVLGTFKSTAAANPELAGAIAGATGLGGLAGFFGSPATTGPTGVGTAGLTAPVPTDTGSNLTLYLVIAAALVGGFFLLRR